MAAHQPTPTEHLPQPSWVKSVVEEQLRMEFPSYAMAKAMASLNDKLFEHHNQLQNQRETRRKALLALSIPELEAIRHQHAKNAAAQKARADQRARDRKDQAIAQAAVKEATKFYNQPQANVDFAHWGKLEYWTFDEALALLLGKDPHVLTRAAMQRELSPGWSLLLPEQPVEKPAFVKAYVNLRQQAERAKDMQGARLRPASVLLWAHNSSAVEVPAELLRSVAAQVKQPSPTFKQPTQESTTNGTQPNETRSNETQSMANDSPTVNETSDTITREELIRKHKSNWPSIDTNLKNATANGLAKAAKATTHGHWREHEALEWARKNNKIKKHDIVTRAYGANNPFNLAPQLKE